jgi:ketosteroid isomerase-like protein
MTADAHDRGWHGTCLDGGHFDVQGVVIYGIEDGRIVRGRLYMGDLSAHTPTESEEI